MMWILFACLLLGPTIVGAFVWPLLFGPWGFLLVILQSLGQTRRELGDMARNLDPSYNLPLLDEKLRVEEEHAMGKPCERPWFCSVCRANKKMGVLRHT